MLVFKLLWYLSYCVLLAMSIEIWAPPNLSKACVREKVDEWIRANPNIPPYERFLQDYISSQWPVLWHLKTKFIINLNTTTEPDTDQLLEKCPICQCALYFGTEQVQCGHIFHTMCIHRWLQRASTCPMCRAEL